MYTILNHDSQCRYEVSKHFLLLSNVLSPLINSSSIEGQGIEPIPVYGDTDKQWTYLTEWFNRKFRLRECNNDDLQLIHAIADKYDIVVLLEELESEKGKEELFMVVHPHFDTFTLFKTCQDALDRMKEMNIDAQQLTENETDFALRCYYQHYYDKPYEVIQLKEGVNNDGMITYLGENEHLYPKVG
ncbi:MAG: hypothetical protein EOP45_12020 [Sphingobacteriaceae bacterium]|nr:MAG: hypothetical protein EOP45_12020 [Sphingobacteriaceae bacterium]